MKTSTNDQITESIRETLSRTDQNHWYCIFMISFGVVSEVAYFCASHQTHSRLIEVTADYHDFQDQPPEGIQIIPLQHDSQLVGYLTISTALSVSIGDQQCRLLSAQLAALRQAEEAEVEACSARAEAILTDQYDSVQYDSVSRPQPQPPVHQLLRQLSSSHRPPEQMSWSNATEVLMGDCFDLS